jgi:hypothetical protein
MAASTSLTAFLDIPVAGVTVDMAGDKAAITQLLIASLVIEQLIPFVVNAVRRVRNAVRRLIRKEFDAALKASRPVIKDVVSEILDENATASREAANARGAVPTMTTSTHPKRAKVPAQARGEEAGTATSPAVLVGSPR